MFCKIQFQDSGETQFVKTEDLIVFGRNNTYTKFEPSNPNDFKPRTEYGLIDGDVIKRCLVLVIAATLETLQTTVIKCKKVSSKRPAVESLAAFTFNTKKSKQDRSVRGAEATDDLISGKLNKANAIAMQVGLEVAAEVIGAQVNGNVETPVNVDGDDNSNADDTQSDNNDSKADDTHNDNKTSKADDTQNDNNNSKAEDTQNDKAADQEPNERVSSSQTTANDEDKLLDTGNSLESENVEGKLVHKPPSEPFDLQDMSDDDNADQNLLKNKSAPISSPNRESVKIDVKHPDPMQESVDQFQLTGDEKTDGDTLMIMFNKMLNNQQEIAVDLKSLNQKITQIFEHIFKTSTSGPSTSAFVNLEHNDTIPGHVCFGEGLYLDVKKIKEYSHDSNCIQTTINNITLGLFKADITSYCLRIPKDNSKGLKLLPGSFIKKLTEVINDENREKSFNAFLQQEKKVLRAMKPDELKEKLEELRKLSDMNCIDMTESEVRSKLSHTLYEGRSLVAKQAADAKKPEA